MKFPVLVQDLLNAEFGKTRLWTIACDVRGSDNLRKGAALNAVQIAELLGSKALKKG